MFVGRKSGCRCQVPAGDIFHMVAKPQGTKDACLHAIAEGCVMSFNQFCFRVGKTSSMTLKIRSSKSCVLSGLRMILSDLEQTSTRLTRTSHHSRGKFCLIPARSPTSLIKMINHFLSCHHHNYMGQWEWVILSGSLKKKDLARKQTKLTIISAGWQLLTDLCCQTDDT